MIKIIDTKNNFDITNEVKTPGYVQTTPFITKAYKEDFDSFYLYATYNYTPGGIYGVKVTKTEDEISAQGFDLFIPDESLANYCICNPIADSSGNIYYKNDSGHLIALERVPLSGNSILSFKIGDSEGEINDEEGTIEIEVDSDTTLKNVVPEITISENAKISPKIGEEVDLREDVTYTVTAEDGTEKKYIVTATKEKSGSSGGGGGRGSASVSLPDNTKKDEENITTNVEESKSEKIDFSDTKNHWAKDYISFLTEKGYITGKTADSFAPDDKITRAEFITILYRISGETAEFTPAFTDVSENAWYAKGVSWANAKKITQGINENEFAPNQNITREQMATFITRFASTLEINLKEDNNQQAFTDESSFSEWAISSIYAMQKAGIISGKDNNIFAPTDNATRAESAKMLAVLLMNN